MRETAYYVIAGLVAFVVWCTPVLASGTVVHPEIGLFALWNLVPAGFAAVVAYFFSGQGLIKSWGAPALLLVVMSYGSGLIYEPYHSMFSLTGGLVTLVFFGVPELVLASIIHLLDSAVGRLRGPGQRETPEATLLR